MIFLQRLSLLSITFPNYIFRMVLPTSTNGVHALSDVLKQSPPNGISVLVVGCGIGGLTAARECSRLGCSVRVFERQPHPVLTGKQISMKSIRSPMSLTCSASGDSFTIGSPGLRSLGNYPRLQQEVEKLGTQPRLLIHKLDGTVIRGPLEIKDLLSSSVDPEMTKSVMRLSRPKLYRAMLDHLERTGVEVQFGNEVVDYFEDEATSRAGVILSDGSRHDADIVVAADGVNSHSWKLVLGREVRARPSGDAIFRVSYPLSQTIANSLIAEKFIGSEKEDSQPILHIYLGYVHYPLPD